MANLFNGLSYKLNFILKPSAQEPVTSSDGPLKSLQAAATNNEPIVLARKPLEKGLTIAENVLKWSTGGLNVDGCRVGSEQTTTVRNGNSGAQGRYGKDERIFTRINPPGRFPANLILDETAAEMLDEQSGTLKSGGPTGLRKKIEGTAHLNSLKTLGKLETGKTIGDSGGASRFFYIAKASKRERNEGLEGMPEKAASGLPMRCKNGDRGGIGIDGTSTDRKTTNQNHHPTVKPIKLMRYLCRLITPPNGTVLDPFTGSGSTGVAAIKEGFSFVGIEREKEYLEIAKRRINHAQQNI